MRTTFFRYSVASLCLVGVAVGLNCLGAIQFPPPETARAFDEALREYEKRMDTVHELFNATMPHEGPLTQQQKDWLLEMMAPKPYEIMTSSENCLSSGGDRTRMETYVNRAQVVVRRGMDNHRFAAKDGWILQKPEVTGNVMDIHFKGTTSDDNKYAYAEIADRYKEGQTVNGIGFRGSGRIKVTCTSSTNSQTHSWSWTLFRDCPQH